MPLPVIGHAESAYNREDYNEAAFIARLLLQNPSAKPIATAILFLSLYHLGKITEANEIAERSVVDDPSARGYQNFGLFLGLPKIARHEESAVAYRKAYELTQTSSAINWGLTEQLLRIGNWDEGWPLFERYGQGRGFNKRLVNSRLWDKNPLGDGKLLIFSDQALGDTIQFSRFVLHLGSSNIRFESHEALKSLFAESFTDIEVVATSAANNARDIDLAAWTPLSSLPAILNTTQGTLSEDIPYLRVPATILQTWQSRVQKSDTTSKVKVGIKWAGENRSATGDDPRSCKLEEFRPICEMEGVSIFNLQKDDPDKELDKSDLKSKIINLMPQVNSMADTAAIIQQMDFVISIDSSVAHLAGALGQPAYVLLREDPDYRWGIDASKNLWYPSTAQFRQTTAGSWSEPITKVVEKLSGSLPHQPLDPGL